MRYRSSHACIILLCLTSFITGCSLGGIRDAYTPPKVKPCQVYVTDGHHTVCMSREEFARWRRRNGI